MAIFQYSDIKPGRIKTDICVIGSGCGGATIAKKLLERGYKVIILEQGGYYPTYTFDNRELNMAGKVSGDRNLFTTTDGAVNLLFGNNVGGASVHYWADSYRTPNDRLLLWEKQFGIKGHRKEDLEPAFEELDRRLNVHPATDEYLNKMNLLVRDASRKLGWQGHRVPQARKNCQKSGHCMQGCAFGAKQSQLVTHIQDVIDLGGDLYADTRAKKIAVSGGRVESLRTVVMDRPSGEESNRTLDIEAKAFVLAAGGFSSSAFLLSNGMGSKLPALGKHIAINPSPMVHALFNQAIIQWRNIPAGYGIDHFRLPKFDAKGNYIEGGYLLMPNQLHPATLAAVLPGYGREHFEFMENLPKLGGTIGWIDDPPDGSITMDGDRKKVDYPMSPLTKNMLRDLIKKQVILNFAAGATKVLIPDVRRTILHSSQKLDAVDSMDFAPASFPMAAPHPAGGCRMGSNPASSVVDSEHKVHGVENLYVSDPAVFPTAVSVDPSYTIMAFSFIAADRIHAHLRKGKV